MDKLLLEAVVHFRAEIVDVNIDDVGEAFVTNVPDVLDEHSTRHRASDVTHQVLEHSEFTLGQVQDLTCALGCAREAVQFEVSDAHRVHQFRWATQHSINASEKLFEGKRLEDVIIRAGLETVDAILD